MSDDSGKGSDASDAEPITVYYDGSCPSCVKDRELYERLARNGGRNVCWYDITDCDEELKQQGIDPDKALKELHIRVGEHRVLAEIDAYIVLMSKVWLLKPIAWLIGHPTIRPYVSRAYRRMVDRRLSKTGRL